MDLGLNSTSVKLCWPNNLIGIWLSHLLIKSCYKFCRGQCFVIYVYYLFSVFFICFLCFLFVFCVYLHGPFMTSRPQLVNYSVEIVFLKYFCVLGDPNYYTLSLCRGPLSFSVTSDSLWCFKSDCLKYVILLIPIPFSSYYKMFFNGQTVVSLSLWIVKFYNVTTLD